jgi:hypothetical protein
MTASRRLNISVAPDEALTVTRVSYGDVPKLNKHGKRMRLRDEFEMFSEVRLRNVIVTIGAPARPVRRRVT